MATDLGGRAQPNSGATDKGKGDFKVDKFLFESKETSGQAINIQARDVVKITREADQSQKIGSMVITINGIAPGYPKEWVMIPFEVFAAMLDANLHKDL